MTTDPLAETAETAEPVSDGSMPCPVTSPAELPCVKHIPAGWTASEGHGGGHMWMSAEVRQALDSGHYDAAALLAGDWATVHQPDDCTPACPRYGGIALTHVELREQADGNH